MAVSTLRTSIVDFSAAPTFVNYGGGAGAALNTDIYIEGVQSAGRRIDNAANAGFGVSFAAVNLSGAEQHVKVWLWVTHWSSTTQVQCRLSDGTNADDHELPLGEYPDLGGWLPLWVDVSRTPEVGGSANEASITQVGILIDINDVGGNAANLILDEITYGTSGLRWDGSTGSFASFSSFEDTNREGVLVALQGVYFCYARLEIGSSTATTFTDSAFQLVFPVQSLVSTVFMGLTFDLQNASTNIDLTSGLITSANVASASRRPDIQVSGTSGTLDFTNMTLTGLRTMVLTSTVTIDGCTIQTTAITQSSAHIKNSSITTNSASGVACVTSASFGASSGIHDCDFVQGGSGHALEITGTSTVTLTNLSFTSYGANTTNSAAILFTATTGSITVNLTGTATPTYKTAGVTVSFVASYTLTLTGVPSGVQVTIVNSSTRTELQNSTSTGADVTYSHSGGETVDILFMATGYDPLNSIYSLTLPTANSSIPISLSSDNNYVNP